MKILDDEEISTPDMETAMGKKLQIEKQQMEMKRYQSKLQKLDKQKQISDFTQY
jgi:hypothetical protein